MSTKRKFAYDDTLLPKRRRRSERSNSLPSALRSETEKFDAKKFLNGDMLEESYEQVEKVTENIDILDPERLGFLMCAHETLNFLLERGIHEHHPMYVKLQKRLLDNFEDF